MGRKTTIVVVAIALLLVASPVMGYVFTFEDWEDGLGDWQGDTGSFSTTASAKEGSQAIQASSSGTIYRDVELKNDWNTTTWVSLEADTAAMIALGNKTAETGINNNKVINIQIQDNSGFNDELDIYTSIDSFSADIYEDPDTGYRAVDYPEGGWVLVKTTQSNGELTVNVTDGNGYVHAKVSADVESGYYKEFTALRAKNSGVRFDTYTIEKSSQDASVTNITPQGGEKIDSNSVELSLDINDSDLNAGVEDTIYWVNTSGGEIGRQTVTQNGTYSTTWSSLVGGENEYEIIVNEPERGNTSYGTYSVNAPDTLYIENETAPGNLVQNPVDVTVRFYGDTQIYERTTSDGTIDLTGLPIDESFNVEIEPNQDYYGRTIRIDSIYNQQTAYLLSKNITSVETRFVIDDPTGEFGSETVVKVQKPINTSGSVEFQTIVADQFGAEGVTTTLEEGRRYRVTIQAPDGTTQVIGPYRADVSEEVTISPGAPAITVDEYQDGWGTNADLNNQTLDVAYSDPENQTTSLKIYIHEKDNQSNQLAPNQTFTDLGSVTTQYSLTANESKLVWDINYIVDRNSSSFTVTETVRNRPGLTFPSLDDEWRLIGGIGMLLFFGGSFSVLNRAVGGIAVGVVGGVLWWAGWLTGATTGAAIALYLLIAIVYSVYVSGGP